MQLTSEQQEQIRHAKANNERRVTLPFTPAQKQDWQQAVEQELGGKEENVSRFRLVKAAAEQPGIFGDVRRAILLSRLPAGELSAAIGVDQGVFSDFRAGEADLPAAAFERLVETLGLRLMHEIPR